MATHKILTILLLTFVAASVGYLVVNNLFLGPSAENVAETIPDPSIQKTALQDDSAAEKNADSKIIAQYFHGTSRCRTCMAIEAMTREALVSGFPEDLKTSRLELISTNLDEPGNLHFVEDYQLTSRTVVIARFLDGKQVDWKRLDHVWELAGNRPAFIDYIQSETKAFLDMDNR